MSQKRTYSWVWFIPILPLSLAAILYFGKQQTSSFIFLNHLAQFFPDTLWAWLTYLGNGWGLFSIAFPLLLLAPRLLSASIFAAAISGALISALKPILNLPRPASVLSEVSFHRIGDALLKNSMPSGHTLTAFAIASAIFFTSPINKRKPLLTLFILAAFVGLSRIGVGAHWLTDVLAGAGIGFWCGLLGAKLSQYIPEESLSPNKAWPRLIALGGLLCLYVLLTQKMDLDLNQPLQFASSTLIVITLLFFTKSQGKKAA